MRIAIRNTFLICALASGTAFFYAAAYADIINWQTGETIPGTEGIVPGQGLRMRDWNEEQRNLRFADFDGIDLSYSTFDNSRLDNSRFRAATLLDVRFYKAKLNAADFDGARLEHARLRSAILTRVNFAHANLRRAEFNSAHVAEADFTALAHRNFATGEPPNDSTAPKRGRMA